MKEKSFQTTFQSMFFFQTFLVGSAKPEHSFIILCLRLQLSEHVLNLQFGQVYLENRFIQTMQRSVLPAFLVLTQSDDSELLHDYQISPSSSIVVVLQIIIFQIIRFIQMNNTLDLFQHYIKKEEQRSEIPIHGEMQAIFDFCEYTIRTEFDKSAKSKYRFKKRKGAVPQEFIRSFNELTGSDKLRYYIKNVNYLVRISSGNYNSPAIQKGMLQSTFYTRSYNLKRWKKKLGRLDRASKILYAEREGSIKVYNLSDYIFRMSKNSDYFSFVLEAINDTVIEKAKTVHIGFKKSQDLQQWAENIQICIDYRHWERLYKSLTGKTTPSSSFMGQIEVKVQNTGMIGKTESNLAQNSQFFKEQKPSKPSILDHIDAEKAKSEEIMQISEKQEEQNMNKPIIDQNRTIIDSLIESDNDEDIEEIQVLDKKDIQKKKNLDLFHRMFPDYELQDLEEENNYEMVFNDSNARLIQSINDRKNYKIIIKISSKMISKEVIFNALCVPEFQVTLLPNLQQITIKALISSENSAIVYQKNKPYNKLYRARDFVFVRHGFRRDNDFYIVNRQIENSTYPPFMTIVRGDYSAIWGILDRKQSFVVVGDITMCHQGYLNEQQQKNLTLNFIKHYLNLQNFCKQRVNELKNYRLFDLGWNIAENQQNIKNNKKRLQRKKQMKRIKQEQAKKLQIETKNIIPTELKINEKEEIPKKLSQSRNLQMEDQGEISIKDSKQTHQTAIQIQRKFDDKGLVIIDQSFIKTKYLITHIPTKISLQLESIKGHPIWKGQWIHDKKEGGIIFIDQKKIQDQKGVLKFILTKIGKNLLSGKSVLNISLPVDIFSPESNLQRIAYSLSYAPKILEPVASKSFFDKFKAVLAFGISSSPLYLSMEKPFNPILGETFQCWINGCPLYAQQISHHPPIGAIYFVGRGYKITTQLESKVELHMNSGCGINDGIYRVKFDDGEEMCFILPGGQVSGLTYGDRKFNMVGKAYYWYEKSNYFCELIYNPSKKGLFSMGKQENPSDYLEGNILQVKPQFLKTFLEKKKLKPPSENDILKRLGKVSGIWHKYLKFQDQVLLDIDQSYPLKLEYEASPLPSDANWRQDIAYRRINEISRAQTEKERLQVLQRQDRKLREKFNKKK